MMSSPGTFHEIVKHLTSPQQPPLLGSIKGVILHDGVVVSEAVVSVTGGNNPRLDFLAEPDGTFEIEVTPGDYSISTSAKFNNLLSSRLQSFRIKKDEALKATFAI